MAKDNKQIVNEKLRQKFETSMQIFDLDIRLVEQRVAYAIESMPDGSKVLQSVRGNLNLLRDSYIQFMNGEMSRSNLVKVLCGVRHAVLSITEQSLSKTDSWSSLRRDLLRSFGKNGIEAEFTNYLSVKDECEVDHE